MSRVNDTNRDEQADRLRAMTADARVDLALALGRQAVADLAANEGISEQEARRRIRRATARGRVPSIANEP